MHVVESFLSRSIPEVFNMHIHTTFVHTHSINFVHKIKKVLHTRMQAEPIQATITATTTPREFTQIYELCKNQTFQTRDPPTLIFLVSLVFSSLTLTSASCRNNVSAYVDSWCVVSSLLSLIGNRS